jgi:MSHA biogenesis protein MshJ
MNRPIISIFGLVQTRIIPMEQIKAILEKIDSLSIRERGIILTGIIFVIFSAWDTLLMVPQSVNERKIISELQTNRTEQTLLNIQYQNLIKQLQGDSDARNRERLVEIKQRLAAVESEMKESTIILVPPNKMAGILRTILNRSNDLELINIKGLGAKPLLAGVPQNSEATGTEASVSSEAPLATTGLENAYKHGMRIEFEGSYMSTLEFLKQIESLEWGFFWENIAYEVIDYPTGRVAITLFTLSLDKNWIGV